MSEGKSYEVEDDLDLLGEFDNIENVDATDVDAADDGKKKKTGTSTSGTDSAESLINSSSSPKPKKKEVSMKKVIGGFLLVVLIVLGYFINGAINDIQAAKEQKKIYNDPVSSQLVTQVTQPKEKKTWGYVENVPSESPVKTPEIKKDFDKQKLVAAKSAASKKNVVTKSKIPSAFSEPIDPTSDKTAKISKGSICELSLEYSIEKEYLPYIKKREDVYARADQVMTWNGKGVRVVQRNIALSVDYANGYVEIEENIFLPIELFSDCTPIR